MIRNATMATTLIAANQYSLSPNILTENILLNKIITRNTPENAHTGIFGNHLCIIIPDTVNSDPKAMVHVSQ